MSAPENETAQEWLGIQFSLPDIDEITFARVLRDVMQDAAFAKPLQIQASEPRPGRDGQLTLAFLECDRLSAARAMQRLKTILLRYGTQVDQVRMPGEGG
ncbi:hypothetical protein [Deinococcus sp.]|uniref:hypothetical protein n=1 Tax=Deinococcus sp. TaxID=47478 RepID=UPI003B59B6B7